jgi:hypothetical protein
MAREFLHVDLILAALIGPAGAPVERLIAEAERGQHDLEMLEIALYYSFCSLQAQDRLDHRRFVKLLRCARVVPGPESSRPLEPPLAEEIARWRDAALNPS